MAGYVVPAVGLWALRVGKFVGYYFNHARYTDRSSKYIATAYCVGISGYAGQFFALVHPFQRRWVDLRYPEAGAVKYFVCLDIYAAADPNMFVLWPLFKEYWDLLPRVPKMNNLAWIPESDLWTAPGGLPRT